MAGGRSSSAEGGAAANGDRLLDAQGSSPSSSNRSRSRAASSALAVVRLDTPDEGHRFRVALDRAFPAGRNAAARPRRRPHAA
jgi:hypothetical protein